MIELIIHTRSQAYANILSGEYPFPIEEIACVLSRIHRYACHHQTVHGLSVARHSVRVASQLHIAGAPAQECLSALLHDAAEAYIGDVTAPVKRLIPEIVELEEEIRRLIFARHNLPPEISDLVWKVDKAQTSSEIADLFPNHRTAGEGYGTYSTSVLEDEQDFLTFYHKFRNAANG